MSGLAASHIPRTADSAWKRSISRTRQIARTSPRPFCGQTKPSKARHCLHSEQSSFQVSEANPAVGRVASLHVHGRNRGEPMRPLDALTLVAGKGIVEDARY